MMSQKYSPGVRGVARSKKARTTKSEPEQTLPKDLVNKDFTVPTPNRLRVADITHAATWAAFTYVAFVNERVLPQDPSAGTSPRLSARWCCHCTR